MANKNIFGGKSLSVPVTDTVNKAGGKAYALSAKQALAQIAVTNCFNGTYYASGEQNLSVAKEQIQKLVEAKEFEFIAKVALYSGEKAHMKDMSAFLTTVLLAHHQPELFHKVFQKVIHNGKMLRNFCQIARSGEAGRKINLSASAPRKAVSEWFHSKTDKFILNASIGNDPSMPDILKMCRPFPFNKTREAFYGYLKSGKVSGTYTRGKKKVRSYTLKNLPEIVQDYEGYKAGTPGKREDIPDLDFRLLDSIMTKEELKDLWLQRAVDGSWTFLRMNLNNFLKYGVFDNKELVAVVAKKLRDREQILRAKAYPYQLFNTLLNIGDDMPMPIKNALNDATEVSLENVPAFSGETVIALDVSGSMSNPITGTRQGSTTSMRCIDVASLFSSAVLRRNPDSALVIPFDTSLHPVTLNPKDSIFTNANILSRFGGGGTNCTLPLALLNENQMKIDTVIYFSDNESWADRIFSHSRGTGMMLEWTKLKRRCKSAKLVLVDLTPNPYSQAEEDTDILRVGGFGDQVFDVIASFLEGGHNRDHWVNKIEQIEL